MFGFGKKQSYEERIKDALAKNDASKADEIARAMFADSSCNENALAWAASSLFERQVRSAFDLLEAFIDRFPGSLHLPRVYFADLLARSSQFDGATHHARIYLRTASDAGALENLQGSTFIKEGVSHSFLLLTAAYTELGARSYSSRLLEHGLRIGLTPRWEKIIKGELLRLQQELTEPSNISANLLWEAFFSSGQGADALYKLCESRSFSTMAKRVDLLEGNFRFNPSFKIDEKEPLMLIFIRAENQYFLG